MVVSSNTPSCIERLLGVPNNSYKPSVIIGEAKPSVVAPPPIMPNHEKHIHKLCPIAAGEFSPKSGIRLWLTLSTGELRTWAKSAIDTAGTK